MYLTDLAFIEEGTPNYTEDNLVNFSKMRMVRCSVSCHVRDLAQVCVFYSQNLSSRFSCFSDFSHHQRNQAVSANSIQDWPSTKGKWIPVLRFLACDTRKAESKCSVSFTRTCNKSREPWGALEELIKEKLNWNIFFFFKALTVFMRAVIIKKKKLCLLPTSLHRSYMSTCCGQFN